MPRRLVSFLGLGPQHAPVPHYTPVRYALDGRESAATPLLQTALCSLLDDVGLVVILGTAEARERWLDGPSPLFARHYACPPLPRYQFVELATGSTRPERWELFEKISGAMTCDSLATAGETEAPSEIVVDVTLGYRSHPVLGMAALSFTLSQWARRRIGAPPAVRVLYGANDARSAAGVAPIWDLTELVLAAQWNGALDAFMRFGRADDLAALAHQYAVAETDEARSRGLRARELAAYSFTRKLGLSAKAFADDLATARLAAVITRSAPSLHGLLATPEAEMLAARFPVLREALIELRERVALLCAERSMDRDGVRATAELVDLYGELQRFAEQMATIREGLVTCLAIESADPHALEPGIPGYGRERAARDLQAGRLLALAREALTGADDSLPEGTAAMRAAIQREGFTPSPTVMAIAKAALHAFPVRNDIEHCGLNAGPGSAISLRNACRAAAVRFRGIARGDANIPHGSPEGPRTGMQPPCFVNLSNHSVEAWSNEQRSTARALGFGEPIDLEGGLPHVDPFADGSEVAALAERIADRARSQGATAAFVAGEQALSFALVSQLMRAGVRCFTTTTARTVDLVHHADGTVEKRSAYRFVRWREYADVAPEGSVVG